MIGALITAAYIAAFVGVGVSGFVLGGFVATRRQPADHRQDEHSQFLGADAGFSNHNQGG